MTALIVWYLEHLKYYPNISASSPRGGIREPNGSTGGPSFAYRPPSDSQDHPRIMLRTVEVIIHLAR